VAFVAPSSHDFVKINEVLWVGPTSLENLPTLPPERRHAIKLTVRSLYAGLQDRETMNTNRIVIRTPIG
jgi:hypothetical protein